MDVIEWMDGWMDGWIDGWMDGLRDGWMDGWMDGWIGVRGSEINKQTKKQYMM
jgi:hypothetical protein